MRDAAGALREQVAVVTGGGRGIGAAIAHKLAELGATTVITGRTRPALDPSLSKSVNREALATLSFAT